MKLRIVALILALFAATAEAVEPRRFGADVLHAAWTMAHVDGNCRLSHRVPRYGEVVFTSSSSKTGDLEFTLHLDHGAAAEGKIELRAMQPAWHGAADSLHLGRYLHAKGSVPVRLKAAEAWRVLAALDGGRMAILSHRDFGGTGEAVEAAISVVHFRPALERFRACAGGRLEPVSVAAAPKTESKAISSSSPEMSEDGVVVFGLDDKSAAGVQKSELPGPPEADVAQRPLPKQGPTDAAMAVAAGYNTLIYFDFGRAELKPQARRHLDLLAEVLRERKDFKQVLIAGHADDVGPHDKNDALSERRASAVRAYLAARGVKSAQVEVRFFGERRPLVPNSTSGNRALNRRVRVQIVR